MLSIEEKTSVRFALFHLGFRPFFILGLISAVILMILWLLFYQNGYTPVQFNSHGNTTWHAHEMIFGYTLAIITGFLLTAVKNWTGIQTVKGTTLAVLSLLWLCARGLAFVHGTYSIYLMMLFDISFNILLLVYFLIPVVRAKQWQQSGIWLIILLLCASHIFFYLGMLKIYPAGIQIGLRAGLYLVILLLLVMARRVVPFFIEKGTASNFIPVNNRVIDVLILIAMIVYALAELSNASASFIRLVSICLVFLLSWQLKGWYTAEIWKKPLLWSLVAAYMWIISGFIMRFAELSGAPVSGLSIHAFAYGGAGIMTASMLCRVALGHTGRNVFDPPRQINILLGILLFGCISRVLLPLFFHAEYGYWIMLAQVCWITSFTGLSVIYVPILFKPRIDGRYG